MHNRPGYMVGQLWEPFRSKGELGHYNAANTLPKAIVYKRKRHLARHPPGTAPGAAKHQRHFRLYVGSTLRAQALYDLARMEQLLNIAWLLAVAGVIVAVVARPHRRPQGPHPWHIVAVVFACVALLLFPVISATDDLHPGSDLSDDAAWRHDKRSLGVQLLAVLILISLAPLLLCRASLLRNAALTPSDIRPGHFRLDSGRAPPFAF
jgi:hypothetical protein